MKLLVGASLAFTSTPYPAARIAQWSYKRAPRITMAMSNTSQVTLFIDEQAAGGCVLSSADLPYRLEFSNEQLARKAAMDIAIGKPVQLITRDASGRITGSLNIPAAYKK